MKVQVSKPVIIRSIAVLGVVIALYAILMLRDTTPPPVTQTPTGAANERYANANLSSNKPNEAASHPRDGN